MKYYIKNNGKTYGPVEENKILDRVLSGYFRDDSLVSADCKEWVPLQQCIPVLRPTATQKTVEGGAAHRLSSSNAVRLHKVVPAEGQADSSRKTLIIAVCVLAVLLLFGAGIYFLLHNAPVILDWLGVVKK